MSANDLTSEELRLRHAADITKLATFETHGVSVQAARDYLDTPEEKLFWRKLVEANPNASLDQIDERAISQIRSGRDLPRLGKV